MIYYKLALPLNINTLYTYSSDTAITKGCRVLVNFNNIITTGFVWEEVKDPNKSISYKEILEVIDIVPLIDGDLLKLAEWMNRYYLCGLGQIIMAMLPTATQIQIIQEIKKTSVSIDSLPDELQTKDMKKLLSVLDEESWATIAQVKNQLPNIPVYKLTSEGEDLGLLDIKRVYDQKIKKKYANFVTVNKSFENSEKLSPKQKEAWEIIKCKGGHFPLALIADQFSYAIVKALKHKNYITITPKEVSSKPSPVEIVRKNHKINLTEEQKNAVEVITTNLLKQQFNTYLLYGVTGSGKTEVYIELIKKSLQQSKTALVLVPEIALTPQMEDRFCSVFGEKIAILHSHLNERERWEEWQRLKKRKYRIVLGARSAIFAPLHEVGIIIVDEEHESSYKQDNNPRYNARDVAVLRGKFLDATVVLGSATPSLESWYNIKNDKYNLLTLSSRPYHFRMPTVKIVDLKEEDGNNLISEILKEQILNRLQRKEQVILLQNRRGYAAYVICTSCGLLHKCPKCDISLIYHSDSHCLLCHYCGYSEKMIRKCPDCGSYILEYGTAGTQQLEKQLQILFPSASLLRMDADTVIKKDSYTSMFRRMSQGTVDILFGTQMIAKGLDFSNVTLVGVISADNSLNIPDYRSAERTFQLLTQVAGRSGRGDLSGEVIIQTYNPEHYAVTSALAQDFIKFAGIESDLRNTLFYPPFVKAARILFSHKSEEYLIEEMKKVKAKTQQINMHFHKIRDSHSKEIRILGPVPAPIHKIKDKFRYHVIIKAESVADLQKTVSYLSGNIKISQTIKIDIDIDPSSLL